MNKLKNTARKIKAVCDYWDNNIVMITSRLKSIRKPVYYLSINGFSVTPEFKSEEELWDWAYNEYILTGEI